MTTDRDALVKRLQEMRERLESLVIQYKIGDQFDGDFQNLDDAIAALSQPAGEQEAVAWTLLFDGKYAGVNASTKEELENLKGRIDRQYPSDPNSTVAPLYTTPPDTRRLALEEAQYRVTQNGADTWIHIAAPSGRKASFNLGHRPAGTLIQSVLDECVALAAQPERKGE